MFLEFLHTEFLFNIKKKALLVAGAIEFLINVL